ncbi:hypothetical protein [Shouchella clausii]|uniref:hypothetical protein n=1 Tax=Shouchella clausii TaxID=79880 RepID=UPI000BA6919E|nr:hypothetical protein [Shouchella clausii]PAD92056.1 hypothetical protein CHH52_11970 [Shouchella clausii]
MAKITVEEKIQFVKTYPEGINGMKTVAESVGVSKAMLKRRYVSISIMGKILLKKAIQLILLSTN